VTSDGQPILPDYPGACIANVVPELIKQVMGAPVASWMPSGLSTAKQVVLLVIDGLGWEQLQDHKQMAPVLTTFEGGPITCVAPSSTASGLMSIVTGRPPSVHGIVGYQLAVGDQLLNVLKWHTRDGDARESINPTQFQVQPPFAANTVPVVSRKHFAGTGFSTAMFRDSPINGYSALSGLPVEVWKLANAGEQFIFAYYDGLDTVSHAHGLSEHYDAELYTVDRLVRDLLAGLPVGCALVVTSEHGQVQVGGRNVSIDDDVQSLVSRYSGEGRFRWLHALPGRADDLAALCRERFSELAWVMSRDEAVATTMFGGPLPDWILSRLGDVALIAKEPVAFRDPTHDHENQMQCRHGSLTPAEMYVPLLAKTVGGAS
jgi:predicted AlkP superfamily pyrophosphatase or phosphodiesterase